MFVKGFTYGFNGRRGMYQTSEAALSMDRLSALGGDWVALAFAIVQDSYATTVIRPDYRFSVTDKDVITAVRRLHERGLKVCLKPMINCADGLWRARIDFPDEISHRRDYWKEWFESYTAFLCHYAEIAQDTGCEMFCVGCEMLGTERKESHWRAAIQAVRKIYTGPLTYNTNHGCEEQVQWWDAVDLIGTSAYFGVGKVPRDSCEAMIQEWEKQKERLARLSQAQGGKQILFMEIGCRSARGCAMMPYDFSHKEFPYDEEEQARFYESCLRVFWDTPWFAGFFWWDWGTFLPTDQPNLDFTVYNKKAEALLRTWYQKKRE